MTRGEAIEKAHISFKIGDGAPSQFVDLAVSLGMLKLEEPKSAPKWSPTEAVKICRAACIENDAFMTMLAKLGYVIVKA